MKYRSPSTHHYITKIKVLNKYIKHYNEGHKVKSLGTNKKGVVIRNAPETHQRPSTYF
jgi:hypothetical protein